MPPIIQSAMQSGKPPAQPPAQQASGTNDVHRIVAAGTKLMYTPEVAKQLIAMIKADADPATGLAHALMFLMAQMLQLSKGTMPPAAKTPAVKELSILLAELAQHAGAIKGDTKSVIIAARKMIADAIATAFKLPQGGAPSGQAPVNHPPFMQR
jgi:hypothetical protein